MYTNHLIEEDIFSVNALHCIVLEYTLCDKIGRLLLNGRGGSKCWLDVYESQSVETDHLVSRADLSYMERRLRQNSGRI